MSAVTPYPRSRAELADRIAVVVLAIPGVAALHPGAFGEIATYLPGRRVNGVRVREDSTEIHVVLVWGAPLLDTADIIRLAVNRLVGHRIDITVVDVVDPTIANAVLSAVPGQSDPDVNS